MLGGIQGEAGYFREMFSCFRRQSVWCGKTWKLAEKNLV